MLGRNARLLEPLQLPLQFEDTAVTLKKLTGALIIDQIFLLHLNLSVWILQVSEGMTLTNGAKLC
jgi:hypothetical protein